MSRRRERADVNAIKSLKGNPLKSGLTADLQKLQTDVNQAIAELKGAAQPKVNSLKSSIQPLKSTFTQVN